MRLNSLYHKSISMLTLAVMLWNIFGWLGTGMLMNHLHTQEHEGEFCGVSFCSCEVKDGNEYCSCHHPELHQTAEKHTGESRQHHTSADSENDFCFYTSPHPVDNNPADAQMVFAKFNALVQSQEVLLNQVSIDSFDSSLHNNIPSGYSTDILRPPRT